MKTYLVVLMILLGLNSLQSNAESLFTGGNNLYGLHSGTRLTPDPFIIQFIMLPFVLLNDEGQASFDKTLLLEQGFSSKEAKKIFDDTKRLSFLVKSGSFDLQSYVSEGELRDIEGFCSEFKCSLAFAEILQQ